MVWSKTEAGRQEIKARSQVAGRAQRTLLLLVDGTRGDAELLASVAGTTAADFQALAALGLIAAPADAAAAAAPTAALATPPAAAPQPASAATPAPPAAPPGDERGGYVDFSRTLTELIARELGLRGFVLTMALEKATTVNELRAVAERTIAAITERKGDVRGRAARRALFGE